MTETTHTQTDYAAVNNGQLWYETAGTGHPLILLHGGLVDSGLWDPQFPVFAQRYQTIRYDLRGHGRSSDAGPAPYSHIEDLHALLDVLEIPQAHILGLSRSGAIVVDFALAHPEIVTALLPVAAGLSGFEYTAEPEIEQRFVDEEAALERGSVDEAVEISLQVWTDGVQRTPEQVDPAVRERVRQMTTALYTRGDPPAPIRVDRPAAARLGEIQIPTLVIVGDQDLLETREVADALAAGIPGARKAVIPNSARHLNLEQPEEFNRIVLDFLAEQP